MRKILLYFANEVESGQAVYVKSSEIADATGTTARQVGVRLRYIEKCEGVPVDVEPWSKTSGSRTWRVCVECDDGLEAHLKSVQGQSEPPLC